MMSLCVQYMKVGCGPLWGGLEIVGVGNPRMADMEEWVLKKYNFGFLNFGSIQWSLLIIKHIYQIVRHQVSYMQLYNKQYAYRCASLFCLLFLIQKGISLFCLFVHCQKGESLFYLLFLVKKVLNGWPVTQRLERSKVITILFFC